MLVLADFGYCCSKFKMDLALIMQSQLKNTRVERTLKIQKAKFCTHRYPKVLSLPPSSFSLPPARHVCPHSPEFADGADSALAEVLY